MDVVDLASSGVVGRRQCSATRCSSLRKRASTVNESLGQASEVGRTAQRHPPGAARSSLCSRSDKGRKPRSSRQDGRCVIRGRRWGDTTTA